jgi:thiol-disulfide isomerase/thioredoxin
MALEFEGDRNAFLKLLKENPGVLIFKFTADWCKPCQTIKKEVDAHFDRISSDRIICIEVNVDEAFDLFAYMKTKKMIKGIPTMLAYKKENINFAPDDCISGAELNEINDFIARCEKM